MCILIFIDFKTVHCRTIFDIFIDFYAHTDILNISTGRKLIEIKSMVVALYKQVEIKNMKANSTF